MRAFAVMLLIGLLVGGCGQSEPRRVWRPSDHGQPPEAQVDPNRMPQQGAATRSQETPAEARARAATALWRVSCARCHGADGRGGGPEVPPGAQMPDMADPAWQRAKPDAELMAAIVQGRGMMPPFGDRISSEGVQALVEHVRTFPEMALGSGSPPADDGGIDQDE